VGTGVTYRRWRSRISLAYVQMRHLLTQTTQESRGGEEGAAKKKLRVIGFWGDLETRGDVRGKRTVADRTEPWKIQVSERGPNCVFMTISTIVMQHPFIVGKETEERNVGRGGSETSSVPRVGGGESN